MCVCAYGCMWISVHFFCLLLTHASPSPLHPQCRTVRDRDMHTQEITELLEAKLFTLTGQRPFVVHVGLHRKRYDGSRDVNQAAQGNLVAIEAFHHQQMFYDWAATNATIAPVCGHTGPSPLPRRRAMFFDIHGQVHSENWIEFGYVHCM